MIKRKLPDYVQGFLDRHGKARHYFRRPGVRAKLPGLPYSTEFMDAYAVTRKAWERRRSAPTTMIGAERVKPGTFAALIASYYRSSEFLTLKPIAQNTYRNRIEKIREEHGDRLVADLQREHVKALMAKKVATPDGANRLLKTLRVLMRHALAAREYCNGDCLCIRAKGRNERRSCQTRLSGLTNRRVSRLFC